MAATGTASIVFAGVGDPVAAGIVKATARPGGNVTGVSGLETELAPKRLEILKAIVPAFACLGCPPCGRPVGGSGRPGRPGSGARVWACRSSSVRDVRAPTTGRRLPAIAKQPSGDASSCRLGFLYTRGAAA